MAATSTTPSLFADSRRSLIALAALGGVVLLADDLRSGAAAGRHRGSG